PWTRRPSPGTWPPASRWTRPAPTRCRAWDPSWWSGSRAATSTWWGCPWPGRCASWNGSACGWPISGMLETRRCAPPDPAGGIGAAVTGVTIKELPEGERPRERLWHQGPAALSNSELLAILLGTGNAATSQSALALAQGLLQWARRRESGDAHRSGASGLRELAAARPDELCQVPGIGPAQAERVVAAPEPGRRGPAPHTDPPGLGSGGAAARGDAALPQGAPAGGAAEHPPPRAGGGDRVYRRSGRDRRPPPGGLPPGHPAGGVGADPGPQPSQRRPDAQPR